MSSCSPTAAPTARQVADDTHVTTASGATFTLPKGWWITQSPDVIVIEEPGRQIKTTLIETPEQDPLKAIVGGDDPAHRTLTILDDQVKYVFTR